MTENRVSGTGERLEMIFVNEKEKEKKSKKGDRKRTTGVPGARTVTCV